MHYDEVAGKRIDTDGKTVAAIVEIVLKWLFTYDKSSSQSDDLSAGAK